MKFVPAGEIIGMAHRVRVVTIRDCPQLPDGEYEFVDTYCTDPSCDCRKTIVLVRYNRKHVSTINYGWETPAFYQKWMKGGKAEARLMSGATTDFASPGQLNEAGVLGLFKALLNDTWIEMFKKNYQAVKAKTGGSKRQ